MIIIGIAGRAGSGKDTVGDVLVDQHGFATASFAFPIKKMVCGLFDYGPEKWDDREWREAIQPVWGCTPRYLAQTLGTEWGRELIKNDLWLELALAKMEAEQFPLVAITDLRFHNEAERIRQYPHGYILHVERHNGTEQISNTGHASEQGVTKLPTDFYIENSGTLEYLHNQVALILNQILREAEHEAVQSDYYDPARANA